MNSHTFMLLVLLLLLGVQPLVVNLRHVLGPLESQDDVPHPRFVQQLQSFVHPHVLRHEETLQ